jgi:hypothetical protein
MVLGLLGCFSILHAQESQLTNAGSDPNHGVINLPTFFGKDTAIGSPFLVRGWLRGKLDLVTNKRLPEAGQTLFFNYDKLHERLYVTDGIKKVWIWPSDSISRFFLVDRDSTYSFEKVPSIPGVRFLQPLVTSEKGYSVYRRVQAKFVAADYKNEGYYTTGRNYDEYVDIYTYYVVYPGGRHPTKLNLNMHSVRKTLRKEVPRLDKFFSQKSGAIDEHTLVLLVEFINQPK